MIRIAVTILYYSYKSSEIYRRVEFKLNQNRSNVLRLKIVIKLEKLIFTSQRLKVMRTRFLSKDRNLVTHNHSFWQIAGKLLPNSSQSSPQPIMKSPHYKPQNLISICRGLSGRFINTTVSTFLGLKTSKSYTSFFKVVPVSCISSTISTCLPVKSAGLRAGYTEIEPVDSRPEQDLILMKRLVCQCWRSLMRSEQNMKAPLRTQTTMSSIYPCWCLISEQYQLICLARRAMVLRMVSSSYRSPNQSPL